MIRAARGQNDDDEIKLIYTVAAVLAIASFFVSVWASDNHLAVGLLQAATLFFTVWASILVGKKSAADAAVESIRPQARSAFRRVKQLYAALGRQRDVIDAEVARLNKLRDTTNSDFVDFEHAHMSLMALRYLVIEQISTADDAMSDWREIVPDEVAVIDEKVEQQQEDVEEEEE